MKAKIHPSADISPDAQIGDDTSVWNHAQIREEARVGSGCTIGTGCYIDRAVCIGDNVKVENGVSIYRGVSVEDGVFIGPHVSFTNDKYPRAITPGGQPKTDNDWRMLPTLVCRGASVGAGSVILPGLTLGAWAMVAAGSVVTHDVPDHGLVMGAPARLVGYVCKCGLRLKQFGNRWTCETCTEAYHFGPLAGAADES